MFIGLCIILLAVAMPVLGQTTTPQTGEPETVGITTKLLELRKSQADNLFKLAGTQRSKAFTTIQKLENDWRLKSSAITELEEAYDFYRRAMEAYIKLGPKYAEDKEEANKAMLVLWDTKYCLENAKDAKEFWDCNEGINPDPDLNKKETPEDGIIKKGLKAAGKAAKKYWYMIALLIVGFILFMYWRKKHIKKDDISTYDYGKMRLSSLIFPRRFKIYLANLINNLDIAKTGLESEYYDPHDETIRRIGTWRVIHGTKEAKRNIEKLDEISHNIHRNLDSFVRRLNEQLNKHDNLELPPEYLSRSNASVNGGTTPEENPEDNTDNT
jgi:hypothetical protein